MRRLSAHGPGQDLYPAPDERTRRTKPGQPGSDDERLNGLGDVLTTAFFSPAKSGRIIWGVGPVILLPTATNNALGSEKFDLGPSVVALTQPGKWTIGVLASQIWSVSGPQDRADINTTYLQPFVNRILMPGHPPPCGRDRS